MTPKLLLALALTCGCSIDHRSSDFACSQTSECNSGRQCIAGFCVVSGSGTMPPIDAHDVIDAPTGHLDSGSACPAPCSTCDVGAMTCTIECMQSDCNDKVVCPPGYSCDILCDTTNACRQGVDCTQAKACTIGCLTKSSCQNVTCGPGPCAIACSGRQSCADVDCSTSCKCDVGCSGSDSCASTTCGPQDFCIGADGSGCSSTEFAVECSTCP